MDHRGRLRLRIPLLPAAAAQPSNLDPAGRVIYAGSMSKVLFPSLRIGYVVLPAPLVDGFVALRGVLDDHGP